MVSTCVGTATCRDGVGRYHPVLRMVEVVGERRDRGVVLGGPGVLEGLHPRDGHQFPDNSYYRG